MDEVVTVNLAGNAYQLEVGAHAALKAYMERAQSALAANPDAGEILRDLERAVADKASAYLSTYKTVVTHSDIARILEEMGPVAGGADETEGASAGPASESPRVRRLYRIRDKYSWTGVSAGLAAYADIDPGLVRLFWILGALFSGGLVVFGYVVLMFLIPPASTPEEIAQAHGIPMSARDVIEQAKRNFDEYADRGRGFWRGSASEPKRAWREEPASMAGASAPPQPVSPVALAIGGVFALVSGALGLALIAAFVFALHQLATTGAVLGVAPPESLPLWGSIIVLLIAFGVINAPISAIFSASMSAMSGRRSTCSGGGGVIGLVVAVVALWWLYKTVPGFQVGMDQAVKSLRDVARGLGAPL